MHPEWLNFLQRQGAVFDADRVLHFGHAEAGTRDATRGAVIADLSGDQGLIAVAGQDARTFLQGQLSTNVLALTQSLSQFSSWSNAKGRVVTTLRVFERDKRLLLSLPQALAAMVLKRLSLYVLRTQVKLSDASGTLCQFGLAGDQAAQLLAACGLSAPTETNVITENQHLQLIRLHGAVPRYAVLGEPSQLQQLWVSLVDHGSRPVGNDVWVLLRILAGEPCIHPETTGHFVAQMLGLEELGAVHFNKGCYLGQEVIARAHYRGAVKRHLHCAVCVTSMHLQPGMQIQLQQSGQTVGEIVDAARDERSTWHMLIVLQDEALKLQLQIHDSAVNLLQ